MRHQPLISRLTGFNASHRKDPEKHFDLFCDDQGEGEGIS